MFENNIFLEDSFKVIKNNKNNEDGFSVETLITYYRGIPLSMVDKVEVVLDGKKIPQEDIRFSVDDLDEFTLDELTTVARIKWEYGDKALIRVILPEILEKGKHEIELTIFIRTAYIPVPVGGSVKRIVEV